MKRIVLITTGQPSVNPRLVKEADILTASDFEVVIIYSHWVKWAQELDKELIISKKWSMIEVGGNPSAGKFTYWVSKIRQKIATYFCKKNKWLFAEKAKARAYSELLSETLKYKADLYIAHNLGALPIAVKVAQKYGVKCGFDAEDFHRHEITNNADSLEYKLCKYLEDKYLPKVNYMSAASPLIADNYKKLYPQIHPTIINNVFSSQLQPKLNNEKHSDLKLFWFSQTIGKGRGIEELIRALGMLKNKEISLNLLGQINVNTQNYFQIIASENNLSSDQLSFISPLPPDEIFRFASQFDIGLALEQKVPLNRDICLTNKIFTYLISGLAVIATETQAQKQLIEKYPDIGKTYAQGDVISLASIIKFYFENKAELVLTKQKAYQLGKIELNWENESKKFVSIVKRTLNM